MTARPLGDGRGCRAYGGCRPGQRCPEHTGTATPVRVADLIAQVLAHARQQRAAP